MLPNGILIIIFQYLSHRFLAQISLVCREWYLVSRSSLFYHTLYIQNKKQLFKFIITTGLVNNKHPGHFVQYLILDDYFQWDPLTTTDLELISVSCPNIFRINARENMFHCDSLSLTKNNIWQRLTYLPLWFTNKNKDWYKIVQRSNQYISLEFAITPDMFQPIAMTDNCDHQHKSFIHIQNDPHLQTQKWNEDFIHEINTNDFDDTVKNIIQNIGGKEYIYYQSKILLFSTTFMHLKHLLLNFENYSTEYNHHILPYSLGLDERTIEAIHQSCPVLESLELDSFSMNISMQYRRAMKPSLSLSPTSTTLALTENPCLFLKKLSLMNCRLFHQNCFHFFATKYPNLADLSLCLVIDPEMNINQIKKEAYKRGFLEMLSAYTYLSTLSLDFAVTKNWCDYHTTLSMREETWVNEEFMFWLASRPDILMDFKYKSLVNKFIDTTYQQKEEYKEEMKHKYIYLDRINKLILYYISSDTILYLKNMTHFGINYDYLTTLVIQNIDNTWYGIDFKFYEWLDLLPNLKKLHLKDDDNISINFGLCSTIDLRQEPAQQQNTTYRLEELEIIYAKVLLRNGFTHLGHLCPSLHTFKLNFIYIEDDCFEHQKTTDIIVMDTPHLKLNQLFIKNIMTPSTLDLYGDKIRPFELIVTETIKIGNHNHNQPFVINLPAYDQKYRIKHKMEYIKDDFVLKENADEDYPNIKIILNCEYVDMICCINF
ncbi:hypothetical protein BJ944DRAFT_266705 [Cunninghamella echinulata]|nr:hypothetical protein BJ944DRAFT_266705 [Cunninghamella echinulata]